MKRRTSVWFVNCFAEKAAAATFVPMKNASATPGEGVTQRHADYEALPWPADIMQLAWARTHTRPLCSRSGRIAARFNYACRLVAVAPVAFPTAG